MMQFLVPEEADAHEALWGRSFRVLLQAVWHAAPAVCKMGATGFCEGERGDRLMQIRFLMQNIALHLTNWNIMNRSWYKVITSIHELTDDV